MPTTQHIEEHFTGSATVREVVIGMADGLTVPFALAAGLSAAVSSTSLIVTAGFAEIAAGAMAMGLGGYLAAKTDAEHYAAELAREQHEIDNLREHEVEEVAEIFRGYGLQGAELNSVVTAITSDRQRFTDFLMRFELGMEKPEASRAPISALTIGASYFVGGLIPLIPYILTKDMGTALQMSIGMTGTTLLIFGAVKGHFTGANKLKSALQTLLVGGLAAGAAFALARALG
ncbi:MAG: VIT1/CCC1 transporter family protein [Alphaproteobacteria bacterium]